VGQTAAVGVILPAFLQREGVAAALGVGELDAVTGAEGAAAGERIRARVTVAAVGGRGTLAGAALGAFVVNGAKSWFTVALPELWLYVLGTLFIAVTLFLPDGIVGAAQRLLEKRARAAAAPAPAPAPGGAAS